jgi:hypothetical protein
MTRLIAAAALIVAAAAPTLACEWEQSAAVDSQLTVASQPSETQQGKAATATKASAAKQTLLAQHLASTLH